MRHDVLVGLDFLNEPLCVHAGDKLFTGRKPIDPV